jgi:DNA-binding HxlR family transcriptional regulator
MLENGKDRFIFTKSYEIAYALFRMAAQIKENDFSQRLRSLGGALLQASAGQDYAEAGRSLQVIECLAKFAGDVNFISPANSNILLGEVYTLDAAIIEYRNAANKDQFNLSDIFSKTEPEATPPAEVYNNPAMENNPANENPAMEIAALEYSTHELPEIDEPANAANNMKAEIRQSTIVDKIRQSGNCRLKEIRELLPDTSERTIRYDLQSLLERHLVERVGDGGPSVYYRIPELAQR